MNCSVCACILYIGLYLFLMHSCIHTYVHIDLVVCMYIKS